MGQRLQIIDHWLKQWNAMLHSFGFHFPFGVAGYDNTLLPGYGFRGAETFDPVIHVILEFTGGAERVNAHGAKEMTEPLARHIYGHRNVSGKWRYPGAVTGAA